MIHNELGKLRSQTQKKVLVLVRYMSENLPTFLKGLRKGHKGGFQRFAKYIMMMAYLVVD